MVIKTRLSSRAARVLLAPFLCGGPAKSLFILLLAATIALSACSSGHSSVASQSSASISGNWQFTVASPSDQSFIGGLQGGFLVQKNGAVTGAAVYSVLLPPPPQSGGNPTVCNSRSPPVTASISREKVNPTARRGPTTFC